jgi:hypothetical protein
VHQCIFFFCLYSCCVAQLCANYLFWHIVSFHVSRGFFPKQQVYASLIQEIHIHVQVKLPERKYIIITHLKHGGARTISDNTLSEEFGTKVALWAVGERGFLHTSWDCRITKASFCCGRAVRFPKASDPSISQRSRAVATKIAISDGYLLQLA